MSRSCPAPRRDNPPARTLTSRLAAGWLAGLTLAVAALAVWLSVHVLRQEPRVAGSPTIAADDSSDGSGEEPPAEKPWGQIECVPIVIAPPLEFLSQSSADGRAVEWNFPATEVGQLPQLLAELGLDEATRKQLASVTEASPAIHGATVRPSREIVLGLSSDARGTLYDYLGQFSQNPDQVDAFRFAGNSLEEWFGSKRVSTEADKLVRPLLYRHGRFLFFADLRSIEQDLPSPDARVRLLQGLSREATFLAKLRISGQSNIGKLVSYWGLGGRAKDVRPLLESLARPDDEQALDITHVLPPFARRRIYTYPAPDMSTQTGKRDCHWTSFNFFAEQPDDRFCSTEEVLRTLATDYYPLFGNPQFGDIVMFVRKGSEAIHSAVYLADNIVYTKNGSSSSHPWMLMKLDDLKDYYPSRTPLEVRFFRRTGI